MSVQLERADNSFVSMCWIIGQFIAGGLLVGIANMPGDIVFKLPFGLQVRVIQHTR